MKKITSLISLIIQNVASTESGGIYIHFADVDQSLEDKFDDGKCRALALRGGGTKGAYEVGALKTMIDMLDPQDVAYDVVVGVSIGGMNAGMFATF